MKPVCAAAILAAFAGGSSMAQSARPPALPEIKSATDIQNNRPRYKEFDLEILGRIEDDQLEQALLDYVTMRLNANPGHAMRVVAGLPKGFEAFYATWLVESEVMNGGFHQYFWNSSSEFAEITASALTTIGDPVAAQIMTRALATANNELPITSQYMKQGTLQAFSESAKRSALSAFDAPFCKRAESFSALRIRYVRTNPKLFVTR
jgi:hypothetical protein